MGSGCLSNHAMKVACDTLILLVVPDPPIGSPAVIEEPYPTFIAVLKDPTASITCSTAGAASGGAVPRPLRADTTSRISLFGNTTEYKRGRKVAQTKRLDRASSTIA